MSDQQTLPSRGSPGCAGPGGSGERSAEASWGHDPHLGASLPLPSIAIDEDEPPSLWDVATKYEYDQTDWQIDQTFHLSKGAEARGAMHLQVLNRLREAMRQAPADADPEAAIEISHWDALLVARLLLTRVG